MCRKALSKEALFHQEVAVRKSAVGADNGGNGSFPKERVNARLVSVDLDGLTRLPTGAAKDDVLAWQVIGLVRQERGGNSRDDPPEAGQQKQECCGGNARRVTLPCTAPNKTPTTLVVWKFSPAGNRLLVHATDSLFLFLNRQQRHKIMHFDNGKKSGLFKLFPGPLSRDLPAEE